MDWKILYHSNKLAELPGGESKTVEECERPLGYSRARMMSESDLREMDRAGE